MSTQQRKGDGAKALPMSVVALEDTRYRLAECIDADGTVWPWLLDTDPNRQNVAVPIPAHERLGSLPKDVLTALGRTCGARTRSGASCRQIVDQFGQRCIQHPDKPRGATSGTQEGLF
ncbi:hypothetical protein SPF06_02535 [Sinomonas sp. JGH33]|uniref:HipA N-terminal subdomain 1 domain-containing protein n=1 Tax=Sinomonas terricola TaxID=3110330 RepID=A0ABU5T1X1_9MICC|nr:hypothetical protein [Sinomonas sp. JGH33]MEA5453590.1 hypothetical protein [Sinomonas sp. JGH33]